jgi:hypothetical protein
MARATHLVLAALVFLLLLPAPAPAQQPWTQWIDLNHCAMTRSGWLAIAQSNPGFGWALAPGAQNNATFAEAAARLDVLRLSTAQSDSSSIPSFRQHCCQVKIWENTQTGQSIIMPEDQLPGFGFQLSSLNKPLQCCEDAALALGSDPLGCTSVSLMSVPGGLIGITPSGPVSLTGPVTIPSNPPVTVASSGGTGGGSGYAAGTYLGCFRDPNQPFDLDGYLERSWQNTPQRCIQTCADKGFRYAGVQYAESCLCGNQYGQFGTADNCTMACTGDGAQVCGGINANSVYATGR